MTPAWRLQVLPLVTSALVALAGCGGAAPATTAAPQTADTGGRSAVVDPTTGSQVYAARCASCHGADLRGTDKGPSHLSQVYEPGHHGDASFRSAIVNGSKAHHWSFGDMAPITGMTDAEITAVITYIREVQRREGFEPYRP